MNNKCPRCYGEVRIDRDEYGWYEQCLMCGYIRDLEGIVEVKRNIPSHPEKVKQKAVRK